MRRQLITSLSLAALLVATPGWSTLLLSDVLRRTGPKIVFLGDSITAGGHYIDYLETWFLLNRREKVPRLINLGLSSETVSGLSEKHHPFPRPYVHDRLDRILEKTKPDIVVACYGINCGIYHPFSDDHLAAYRGGVGKLIDKVKASGGRVILLTPPPYAGRVSRKTEPADGIDFGYKTPFKDYDDVMDRYAHWVLSLDRQDGVQVVDVRTPLLRHLDKAYTRDPIHPNRFGHELLAEAFLAGWGANTGADVLQSGQSAHERDEHWKALQTLVRRRRLAYDKALLDQIGHNRPGTRAKYSIDEAVKRAKEIDEEIKRLLQSD